MCRNQLLVSNLSLIEFGNQPCSLGWGKRIVLLSLGYCPFSTRSTCEHTHIHTYTHRVLSTVTNSIKNFTVKQRREDNLIF